MNALTSALWDAFSFVADTISRAVANTAFFMEECFTKIRYLYKFGTTDPVSKMMRLAKESKSAGKLYEKNNTEHTSCINS